MTHDGVHLDLSAINEPAVVLDLEVVAADGQVVVSPRGEIDIASAPLLSERLDAVIPAANERLVIDLSETTFLDSTALAVLVQAYKRLGDTGAEFVLRAPSKRVGKVLAITGLDRLMTIEDAP